MKKAVYSFAIMGITVIIALTMMTGAKKNVTEAEIVTVERADVHQVIPLCGQLTYANNRVISADRAGVTTQVCVKAGDRIGVQAAMVRMESFVPEAAQSALAVAQERIDQAIGVNAPVYGLQSVVRSAEACTVRQVFVEEGTAISAGMPLLRISSHQQRIVCDAAPKDAAMIAPGMWAWLTSEGETLCHAEVESIGERWIDAMTGMEMQEIVLIPDKELELAEYAMVDVDVYLAGSDDVLSLPLQAITEQGSVWWINGERCTEISAQVVLSDEMRAWVQLPEGMRVAIGEFEEGQYIREVSP